MRYSALMTDLYEVTMLAGYLDEDMHEKPATFDLFFRSLPFRGSYAVFAGLESALQYLSALRFTDEDLAYLASLGIFKNRYLDFLRNFRFRGTVSAPPEGTLVFPNEPLLTVEGTLAEAQYVETALLNLINFQTLVATKAARLTVAAGPDGSVIEFGLRRAQGPNGGLSVARAACIGGVRSTSNVWGGQEFGIPVKGTHAHSWIMAFDDELSAFRAYAECFPDSCVLLVDTYDTLKSGIPNAITVARELRERGHDMLGVRLDSGDLAYLSRKTRHMLDEAGFPDVKILASNELDETVIQSIRSEGGCIDIYGVGTRLATCQGENGGALGGVYKLVRFDGRPKMKITSDIAKATLPDRKKVWRVVEPEGTFHLDLIGHEGDIPQAGDRVYDPLNPARYKDLPHNVRFEPLHQRVMEAGQVLIPPCNLDEAAERCARQLGKLPAGSLRLTNPHLYKVSITQGLHDLRSQLMQSYHARGRFS